MPDGDNAQLPDLDYAMLAEFAKVDPSGTLTTVGASFTVLQAPTVPTAFPIAIAGRLRMIEEADPVAVTLAFSGPEADSPRLNLEFQVASDSAEPYDGRVGVLFAVTTMVPVSQYGVHEVSLSIDGRHARCLRFRATT